MQGRDYYAAVAEIIPILFLALAIGKGRVHVRETLSPRTAIVGALFIGILLVSGEVAALRVLQGDRSSNLTEFLSAMSLAIGFGLVIHYIGRVAYKDMTGEDSEEAPAQLSVLLDLSWAIAAVAIFVALKF